MSLSIAELKNLGNASISLDNIPSKIGLSLDDLKDKKIVEKITTQQYIKNEFVNPDDSYIVDIETYNLNSKIRCIQLYDIVNKTVHFFVNGEIENQDLIINHLKKFTITIKFHLGDEKTIINEFFNFLHDNPKNLIGHNLAHFDLGVLQMKKTKYNINCIKLFGYATGSGATHRRMFFSYMVKTKDDVDKYWWRNDEKKRHLIIDTMYISFTLGINSRLHDISRKANSQFPKRNVDYKVFEHEILNYEIVLYSIYDVLAVPDVLRYLHSIIKKPSEEFLKIKFAQSQLCLEHVWMKGAGALSEGVLHKLLGNSIDINIPDFLSKYFGGYCRAWNKDLIKDDVKYLDFTSAYPFSIRKQKLFDILNGKFEYITNKPFYEVKDKYNDLIYSTTFRVKAKEKINVVLEVEKDKKENKIGIGFLRSFNRDMKVQDMQHQLAVSRLLRGETIILTKTELEISKTIFSGIENKLEIVSIIDGMIATSDEKSEQYIQIYGIRNELKKKNDEANLGFKVLLNSCYGKIAESRGEWFNLAIASAVTGFVRSMLIKTIFYSQSLGAKILYNDTDGFHCSNITEEKIIKIQNYAEQLNEYPSRFGDKNLKIEDENISLFWGIKRKCYCKLADGKFVFKGQNGNSDIRWRDVLFRLSALTNGCTDIREINKKIQEGDFELHAPILKTDEGSLKDLKDKLKELKKEISQLRVGVSNKQQNWVEFFEKIYPIVEMPDNFGECLADEEETSISYNYYFRKLAESFGFDYDIKDANMFLYIFEKLKADYHDGDILLGLLSNIGNVDLSFYVSGREQNSNFLQRELKRLRDEIKSKTYDFEMFSKKIYDEYKDKKISEIFQVKTNAIITRKLNVHLRSSVTYQDGVYYKKIVDAWEKRTGEKAYCGLFFSINRDYSFEDKSSDMIFWGMNYENYYGVDDTLPFIDAKFYNSILNQEIRLDTIRLKSRKPINMFNIDEKKRSLVTSNIMSMGSIGVTKQCHDLNSYYKASIYRLRIPKNLSVEDTIFLTKDKIKELRKNKREIVYSNATLFLTNRILFEGAIRINKINMFIGKRDVFNIYRFFSKLGSYTQKLLKKKLAEEKIIRRKKEEVKTFSGIELDYIPRFTFCSQADVNQEISFENLQELHLKANKLLFRDRSAYNKYGIKTVNRFIAVPILDYFHVIGYDKRNSAEHKYQHQIMEDWERKIFEKEKEEDCRSEIKFKLQRNYYETLSYIFSLNCIDQKEIGNKLIDIPEEKFARKIIDVNFSSHYSAHVEFNQNKCVIMFNCNNIQVYELMLNSKVVDWDAPLEGSWEFYAPPKKQIIENKEILEKYRVRWRFETNRRLDVGREEIVNLEVVRDF